MGTENKIKSTLKLVHDLLIEKNKNYGDSALHPSNIFWKGNALDGLCARADDKLMRIKNAGLNESTEDTLLDLIGYMVLIYIAKNDRKGDSGKDG